MTNIELSPQEKVRYARQTSLPEVGVEGQLKLKKAKVLLIGAGGLGGPIALYLAAAGVGELTVVDADDIELSNLHRQVLYTQSELGQKKAWVAAQKLQAQNPSIKVHAVAERLTKANALSLIEQHDIVVDGTDNFSTRYLINDACVIAKKPCVFGSIYQFEGMVSVFGLADGPCYRCLYPEAPPADVAPSCAEGGVLGILPGVIGLLQATEVIKLITGLGEVLKGRILQFNALSMQFDCFELTADVGCKACHADQVDLLDHHVDTTTSCALTGPSEQDQEHDVALSAAELKRLRLQSAPILIDVRTEKERLYINIDDDLWLPLDQLESRAAEFLALPGPIVFYCQSGVRSNRAAQWLREKGAENAYSLTGGVLAWFAAA